MLKRNIHPMEDEHILRAREAVCREDMVLSSRGKPHFYPFYFTPAAENGAPENQRVRIGKNRVIISLLVAPRRCGKTTLLSSLQREFRKTLGDDFFMEPFRMNPGQSKKLDENRQSLTDFANAPGLEEGLAPSDALEIYEYVIYSKNHPSLCFLLRFIDVPGEWVNARQEAMKTLISGADVLYLTIHSPALMEEDGAYNEEFNATSTILRLTDVLKSEQIGRRNRLLLFVPIKCEKYYWDMIRGADADGLWDLNQRIRNRYGALIDSVKNSEHLKDCTTVAITPIMTVGGAKFTQFMPIENDTHKDTYIRIIGYISQRNGYRPTFCEQPLLYTLCFIKEQVMNQVKKTGLATFFGDARTLGLKTAFHYAFRDPLCEAIVQKTRTADFDQFQTVEDFQKTESVDAGVTENQYPDGLFADVDILGYSILLNPQGILDVKRSYT